MIINGKQVCVRDGAWKECEVKTHLTLTQYCSDTDSPTEQTRVVMPLLTSSGKLKRNTRN